MSLKDYLKIDIDNKIIKSSLGKIFHFFKYYLNLIFSKISNQIVWRQNRIII